jgi:shikimate dehydrogenase
MLSGGIVEVDGRTQLVGIIGWPVGHSLSPRMHNAAFKTLGLNFAYVPLPVMPDRLEDAVRGLGALGFTGANVTVPHKHAVLPFVDELSPVAAAVGAVNTLVVTPDGTIAGHNTDVYGFMAALREAGWPGDSSSGRRALVIGAGGAARAVAYGLRQAGAEVWIANRSFGRALELCEALKAVPAADDCAPKNTLSAHRFPEELASLASAADLIVNTTSLGLHVDDLLPWDAVVPFQNHQLVCDLVPAANVAGLTPFLDLAASGGARVLNGLGMLLYQGARAFELWTGMEAPLAVMREALA